MSVLGVMLLSIALLRPPEIAWAVFLLVLGAASLYLAFRMYEASTRVVELTRTELRDDTGRVIALVADIQNMDRGVFAFKPSNGFLLRTARPAGPRAWQPGMWWRLGRQVGIGGVMRASQSKFMSEMIAALILERDGEI